MSYSVQVHAGAYLPSPQAQNSAIFKTQWPGPPDPNAITYKIFKAALLATVEAWDPVDGVALPNALMDLVDRQLSFHEVWIQYLSAPLARLITPPSTSINEWLPNGGLLMLATTETFITDNPAHLAVARDIAAATAPLNTHTYVVDPQRLNLR